MTDQPNRTRKVYLPPLIKNTPPPPQDRRFFSNHVQITMQGTELYLDFYTIEPVPGDIQEILAIHQARITLPIFASKAISSALVNVIMRHQINTGALLPDPVESPETDMVDLWGLIDHTILDAAEKAQNK